jgi:hypothetical protein
VKRVFFTSIVVLLYALVVPYSYLTAGDPRKAAILNAQSLADEKWAREATFLHNDNSSAAELNNTAIHSMVNLEAKSIKNESIFEIEEASHAAASPSSSSSNYLASWFGPTKEQRRAQKELEEWKEKFSILSDDGRSVVTTLNFLYFSKVILYHCPQLISPLLGRV